MTELQREVDATGAATLAQVTAASKKYVAPDKRRLLLVGDLAKIEPGIRSLNLGEVVILDVEGRESGEDCRHPSTRLDTIQPARIAFQTCT